MRHARIRQKSDDVLANECSAHTRIYNQHVDPQFCRWSSETVITGKESNRTRGPSCTCAPTAATCFSFRDGDNKAVVGDRGGSEISARAARREVGGKIPTWDQKAKVRFQRRGGEEESPRSQLLVCRNPPVQAWKPRNGSSNPCMFAVHCNFGRDPELLSNLANWCQFASGFQESTRGRRRLTPVDWLPIVVCRRPIDQLTKFSLRTKTSPTGFHADRGPGCRAPATCRKNRVAAMFNELQPVCKRSSTKLALLFWLQVLRFAYKAREIELCGFAQISQSPTLLVFTTSALLTWAHKLLWKGRCAHRAEITLSVQNSDEQSE